MRSEWRHQAPLILNIVLAVTVAVLSLHKLGRASAASASQVNLRKMAGEPGAGNRAAEMPVVAKHLELPRYGDIKSASDRRRWIIDQLRTMDVPNDVLALVARVDFEVQWDSRFEECWGNRDKMAKVQLEMDMSKDAEMRAALGEEGFKQWDQKNMLWEAMSTEVDVTASEGAALYDLKKKLQQRELDLEQAKENGTMDDAEIADALNTAHSEFNEKMKALLGEDRYAKSQQLDDAFQAGILRHQLAGANPSDSQFQELFEAQQQRNQSLMELDPSSPDYAEQYKALNDALDQEYQQTLGSNAFHILQESQDPGYSLMKKYENSWGLDDSKIDYVYNTMKNYAQSVQDYQAQFSALQSQGQNVDWDAVNAQLQQLTDQTGQALQNYLGQDSFNRLQRNHLFLFNRPQSPQ
ncbi:MAG: hypothetical protein ACLQU4_20510 [Limisphaerales bacterium]